MSTSVSDTTPLLSNGSGAQNHSNRTFGQSLLDSFKTNASEISWVASYKFFIFGSWLNILLVFIPLSFLSHYLNWDAALRFSFSFLAIIPLAGLLGEATDQLSVKLGQTLSGLLNASFGNAVEIIVGIAALLNDEMRIVQTSLIGSILSNLLLVLGCSFFAGGFYYQEGMFEATGAQAASSLMTLACITLVIPAAYHGSKPWLDENSYNKALRAFDEFPTDLPDGEHGLRIISRGTAILLLIVYAGYLFFQLKTHPDLFKDVEPESGSGSPISERNNKVEATPKMNPLAAGSGLLLATLITAFCAEFLVASIEETAERYHIPKAFIGLILLPIVGNAAEHVTAVWMAMKGKTALTISICVGSSIQIATLVIPLMVIIGWISGHDLTLFFADFETIILFVSVILVNTLIMDGKSNYMEGLMLISLYLVIALAFWVS